jgi:hypothetical protein
MAAEEFSRAMHRVGGATLGAREAFETATQRFLAAINLPSRQDMTGIDERLQCIEAQLARLTQLVERMAGTEGAPLAGPTTQKPKRTRRPPGEEQDVK